MRFTSAPIRNYSCASCSLYKVLSYNNGLIFTKCKCNLSVCDRCDLSLYFVSYLSTNHKVSFDNCLRHEFSLRDYLLFYAEYPGNFVQYRVTSGYTFDKCNRRCNSIFIRLFTDKAFKINSCNLK